MGSFAVVAFLMTPFVVTLLFRLLPESSGWALLSLPFAVVGGGAIACGIYLHRWRVVAASVLLATLLHITFFWWLFSSWPELD